MGRKLATLSLLTTLGCTTSVFGLGLGAMNSESALNERLSARIALMSVNDTNLSNIKVSLASADAFRQAGLERPFYLSAIDFEVLRGDGGEVYVEVTSKQPIKEPFLDFLVQVRWPQGRLLREYTVLLDPPVYTDDPNALPGDVNTAVASGGGDAAPAADNGDAAAATGSAGAAVASAPVPATASSEVGASPDAAGGDGGGTYGPVRVSDTLYQIADEVRPDGVSVNQAMLALLRANPNAFIGGNINRLKRGAELSIPARSEITQLSAADATRQVREQMARWRSDGAEQIAQSDESSAAPATGSSAESATSEATTASADETAATSTPSSESAAGESVVASGESDGQLKVVAPDDSQGDVATTSLVNEELEATAGNIGILQNRLSVLDETNASLQSENADLKGQLATIKEELAEKQAILNLRIENVEPIASGSTADSDNTALAGGDGSAEAGTATVAGGAAADEMASAEKTASAGDSTATKDGDNTPATGTASEASSNEGMASAESAGTGDSTAAGTGGPADTETASDAVSSSEAVTTASEPESGATAGNDASATEPPAAAANTQPTLTERLIANAQWLGLGAAAILALLTGLLIMRRRRQNDDASIVEESELNAVAMPAAGPREHDWQAVDGVDDRDALPESDGDIAAAGAAVDTAERHRQAGELAEAQEVLDAALGEHPEDSLLRFKLLEVLAERNDQSGFEAEAQVLHTQLDSADDPLWQKTVALGQAVAPEHPLFASSAAATDLGATEFTPVEESSIDRGDESSATLDDEDDSEFDLTFDFDMDDHTDDGEAAAFAGDDWVASLEDDAQPSDRGVEETAARPSDSGDVVDFDLADEEADFQLDESERDTRLAAEDDDLDALEFELPADLEGDDRAESSTASDGSAADDDTVLDFGAFSADRNAAEQSDDDDLDALDEAGTKLDLAKAYLDMGDPEGARDLLEEVVVEGDTTQKEQAQQLLRNAG